MTSGAAAFAAADAVARVEWARSEARRQRRLATWSYLALFLALVLVSAWASDFGPAALAAGVPRIGEYFALILPDLRWDSLFADSETEGSLAYWMYRLDEWAWLLFETANMAAMATLGASMVAGLLAFPAARTVSPSPWLAAAVRRFLEICRTVPEIVFALIFVWAFGVGAVAGILAIAIHSAGALGKLFAEVVENADLRPVDGVVASGGTWVHAMRFGLLPQVLPNFASYALLRFEINVRAASVIGFVGAGGIGQELYKVISFNYYEEVSALLVLIILVVSSIDLVSERVRLGLIGASR